MSERREIRVTVFDQEQYGEWVPEKLIDAIAWLTEKLEGIPQEFRSVAKIDIDSASGYEGSHYGHIVIRYNRAETNEEMNVRIVEARRYQEALERSEIETLRRLKAKHEGK